MSFGHHQNGGFRSTLGSSPSQSPRWMDSTLERSVQGVVRVSPSKFNVVIVATKTPMMLNIRTFPKSNPANTIDAGFTSTPTPKNHNGTSQRNQRVLPTMMAMRRPAPLRRTQQATSQSTQATQKSTPTINHNTAAPVAPRPHLTPKRKTPSSLGSSKPKKMPALAARHTPPASAVRQLRTAHPNPNTPPHPLPSQVRSLPVQISWKKVRVFSANSLAGRRAPLPLTEAPGFLAAWVV